MTMWVKLVMVRFSLSPSRRQSLIHPESIGAMIWMRCTGILGFVSPIHAAYFNRTETCPIAVILDKEPSTLFNSVCEVGLEYRLERFQLELLWWYAAVRWFQYRSEFSSDKIENRLLDVHLREGMCHRSSLGKLLGLVTDCGRRASTFCLGKVARFAAPGPGG